MRRQNSPAPSAVKVESLSDCRRMLHDAFADRVAAAVDEMAARATEPAAISAATS